ncbi:hypothetical protein HL658_16850 [Azospirillum sp. RWY-5-1]|uniref:Tat pathway signal protein n=1 Tax=Azospirillum oleiclasticum TaxID=2735135 RepID=A0ABX2TEI8_9PROT|nr:hypothetical protein [Azospirillum oleiclasticum]NYZ14227.1 hypothetical protein [Azospirillum oleiclasticum]NYZ21711.1 hypothetical protein [Azospirillum oleiclasticum]
MADSEHSTTLPVSRRHLLAGACALAVTAPAVASGLPVTAGAAAAEVPPVVALCGAAWEKEWLAEHDPQVREFIELMCELKHRLPSDEYDEARNSIYGRIREARDTEAAGEDIGDQLPPADLLTFQGTFDMVAETIGDIPPDRALTISINAMRAARGRWGKDQFANANMNALMIAHAYTGLMLTSLGHPDFLTEEERAAQEAA